MGGVACETTAEGNDTFFSSESTEDYTSESRVHIGCDYWKIDFTTHCMAPQLSYCNHTLHS